MTSPHIWSDKKKDGSVYKQLRYSGKKYNKRIKGSAGKGCIPRRIDIKERAKIVEKKVRIGDWELDTIIGAQQTAEEAKDALITKVKEFV